jgi:4-hydroxy-tetrahydrodipicolinate synthase
MFIKNIEAQADAGVDGIVIGGSLGESSTINHDERLEMLRHSLAAVGKNVDVIVNIAEGSTKKACELAKKAEDNGAHGLMVLPPMMYKPTNDEVVEYYIDIANSTSLPIMVYNNPIDYKIEITMDMFASMAPYQNIEATKESTRDISNVTRMINLFGSRYKILCGVDTLAMEEIVMGADGWVAGLVDAFPHETVSIFRLVKQGKIAEAQKIYRWFMPLLELDIHPQLVQNIKLAESMTGLGTEFVRPPRKMLRGAERERVIAIIQKAIETRPEL